MRNLVVVGLVAVAVQLSACTSTPEPRAPEPPGQSFAAAMTVMCDVDRQAGLSAETDPLGVGAKRTAWIMDKVDNPDAIELRTLMSVKGAAEQARMLRGGAKGCGVAQCALADSLEKNDVGGISP
jgi:hypothetical protein